MQDNNAVDEISTVNTHQLLNNNATQPKPVKYYSSHYPLAGLTKKLQMNEHFNIEYYEQVENEIPELAHYYIVNNITIFTTFSAYYQKLLALDGAETINPTIVEEAYKKQIRVMYKLKNDGVLIANYLNDLDAAKEYMVYLCAYVGNKN